LSFDLALSLKEALKELLPLLFSVGAFIVIMDSQKSL
jgi:hypothetical protein